MAMTDNGMAEAICSEIESSYGVVFTGDAKTETMKYFTAISKAVIDYVKDNAEVIPGTFANSAGNVTGIGKIK